jgi:hypothetical protein
LASTLPIPALRAWAQTAAFPGDQGPTLLALAAVVLPQELGPEGVKTATARFEKWVREYRPGADTDHGYGKTRVVPKGPSPAATYAKQLADLHGNVTAAAIEAALEEAKIRELPRLPDGRHVAADLMSFYFRGADANDLCYRRAIGRDKCRGLDGSDKAPAPLKGTA